MELEQLDQFLERYRVAWVGGDAAAGSALFTEGARYAVFGADGESVRVGRDAIHEYWQKACDVTQHRDVTWGVPVLDGDRMTVEWWLQAETNDSDGVVAGCMIMSFDDEGLCLSTCNYATVMKGRRPPPSEWGSGAAV